MNEIVLGTDTAALTSIILGLIGTFVTAFFKQKNKTTKATDQNERLIKFIEYIQEAFSDGKITKEEASRIATMGLKILAGVKK